MTLFGVNPAAEEGLAAVGAVLRSIQVSCLVDVNSTPLTQADHTSNLQVVQDQVNSWPLECLHAVSGLPLPRPPLHQLIP